MDKTKHTYTGERSARHRHDGVQNNKKAAQTQTHKKRKEKRGTVVRVFTYAAMARMFAYLAKAGAEKKRSTRPHTHCTCDACRALCYACTSSHRKVDCGKEGGFGGRGRWKDGSKSSSAMFTDQSRQVHSSTAQTGKKVRHLST